MQSTNTISVVKAAHANMSNKQADNLPQMRFSLTILVVFVQKVIENSLVRCSRFPEFSFQLLISADRFSPTNLYVFSLRKVQSAGTAEFICKVQGRVVAE